MPVLEPQINALWVAKQTAKGTPATSATKRPVFVGGDLQIQRADGSEPFSTLTRFNSATDFVDTLTGGGEPAIQGHADMVAYLAWLFCGQETVTGVADPWTHVAQPGTSGPFYSTWWKRIGAAVGPVREKYNDAIIGQLTMEGSQGQKVLHVNPALLVGDPGITFAVDPTVALPTTDPLLFTEAVGTFSVDGTVYKVSSFQLVANENRSPYYGDDVVPVDFPPGAPTVTISLTLLVDTAGLAEYNKRYYGTASPSAGSAPIHVPDALGVFTSKFTKKDVSGPVSPERSVQIDAAGVKWTPDVAIAANPAGGATEITLAGECRLVGVNPLFKVTSKIGEAAFTA
jgi:hypothetical protein